MSNLPTSTPESIYKFRTSASPQPGYQLNPAYAMDEETGYLPTSNTGWKQAALDLLAYEWAQATPEQRNTWLSSTWVTAKYGTPDPNDGVYTNPVTGEQMVYNSPRTIASLSSYISQYQGGDPFLDSILPYVAPRADEFVESPAITATRIAQFNADREYGLSLSAEQRMMKTAEINAAVQREIAGINAAAQQAAAEASAGATRYAADQSLAGTKYASDRSLAGSVYGTQAGFLSDVFGTQGGIYNQQETNRLNALRSLGDISLGYQGLLDTRTNNIIQHMSNPADFVQRAYATRALTGPIAQNVPGYQSVPSLQNALSGLEGWQANPAPVAPSLPSFSLQGILGGGQPQRTNTNPWNRSRSG